MDLKQQVAIGNQCLELLIKMPKAQLFETLLRLMPDNDLKDYLNNGFRTLLSTYRDNAPYLIEVRGEYDLLISCFGIRKQYSNAFSAVGDLIYQFTEESIFIIERKDTIREIEAKIDKVVSAKKKAENEYYEATETHSALLKELEEAKLDSLQKTPLTPAQINILKQVDMGSSLTRYSIAGGRYVYYLEGNLIENNHITHLVEAKFIIFEKSALVKKAFLTDLGRKAIS